MRRQPRICGCYFGDRDRDIDLGGIRILGVERQRTGRTAKDSEIVTEAHVIDVPRDQRVVRVNLVDAACDRCRISRTWFDHLRDQRRRDQQGQDEQSETTHAQKLLVDRLALQRLAPSR